jgi:hypothetical protein
VRKVCVLATAFNRLAPWPMPPNLLADHVQISGIQIPQHAAGKTLDYWRLNPTFANHSALIRLQARFGLTSQLTRADLFSLGTNVTAGRPNAEIELLLAVFIWGSRGVNLHGHASGALAFLAGLPGVITPISTTFNVEDAYQELGRGGGHHVPGLGESYFTKYLYFLHHSNGACVTPKPLILDNRVWKTLQGQRPTLAGAVLNWQMPAVPPFPGFSRASVRYALYCISLDSWSTALTAIGPAVTPDQIEYYLFA